MCLKNRVFGLGAAPVGLQWLLVSFGGFETGKWLLTSSAYKHPSPGQSTLANCLALHLRGLAQRSHHHQGCHWLSQYGVAS